MPADALIRISSTLDPSEPLWKRAPRRDTDGRAYGDFMMLIPGLRDRPRHAIESVAQSIRCVLLLNCERVVFAELNLRLNLLWVTVRPGRGLALRVASEIHARVPEARLVAPNIPYR